MFVEHLRHAVEASPRVELAKVAALLWRAYAAGTVTEAEASALSDMIEARKALPASAGPAQRRVGSRPRTPASIERRRSWASAGRLPPALAARFTPGEQAVMAVIAAEVARRGDCRLHLDHLAALAGVGRSTVKRALREAHSLGLIRIEERRLSAWRNDSNVVRIVSLEWLAWLRVRRRGEGSNRGPARIPGHKQDRSEQQNRGRAAERQGRTSGCAKRGSWTRPERVRS